MVSGDLREASVELLHLSVRYFPNLKYATVWDDQRLIFFWSKPCVALTASRATCPTA